jgi:anti-sigma B factor antagonist
MPARTASAPVQRIRRLAQPSLSHRRTSEPETGRAIVSLSGSLEPELVGELRDVLIDVVDTGAPQIIVDMREVTFICSRGLGALVVAAHRARDNGQDLFALAAHPGVLRVLEMTGLDQFLQLCASISQVPAADRTGDSA